MLLEFLQLQDKLRPGKWRALHVCPRRLGGQGAEEAWERQGSGGAIVIQRSGARRVRVNGECERKYRKEESKRNRMASVRDDQVTNERNDEERRMPSERRNETQEVKNVRAVNNSWVEGQYQRVLPTRNLLTERLHALEEGCARHGELRRLASSSIELSRRGKIEDDIPVMPRRAQTQRQAHSAAAGSPKSV